MKIERKKINVFSVCPLLITIDGPDGSGKSTFSEIFTSEIKKRLGTDKAILVRPTRFDCSSEARELEESLNLNEERMKLDSKTHNSFFLDALQVNYEKVVLPALESGKIVIIDSSEIRALAFILEKGDEEARTDTYLRIKNGAVVCWCKPKTRIVLNSNPEDLLKNLMTKKVLDRGDPRSIEEIRNRQLVYKEAIDFIRDAQGEGVNWLLINIQHTNKSLYEYWLEVIKNQRLISILDISE